MARDRLITQTEAIGVELLALVGAMICRERGLDPERVTLRSLATEKGVDAYSIEIDGQEAFTIRGTTVRGWDGKNAMRNEFNAGLFRWEAGDANTWPGSPT